MNIKSSFLLFILFIFILGCKPNSDTSSYEGKYPKIGELKKAIQANPSNETRKALIDEYKSIMAADLGNAEQNGAFSRAIAILEIENNAIGDGVQTLISGIKDNFTAKETENNTWELFNIYKNQLKTPEVDTIIAKFYAEAYPTGRNIDFIKKHIAQSTSSVSDDISALGSAMYNDQTHRVDFRIASDFIQTSKLFAIFKATDPQSPDLLHKAGETARSIRAFPQAISIYDWIYKKFPNHEKAPLSLFLKAFTYDNDLNDKETAKKFYEEFLQKYPTNDFADDTQFLLSNLGKGDDEIIKGFGKK